MELWSILRQKLAALARRRQLDRDLLSKIAKESKLSAGLSQHFRIDATTPNLDFLPILAMMAISRILRITVII